MNQLKHFEVFFRVPAGQFRDGKSAPYASFLSSTRQFARTRAEAIRIVAKRYPGYTELH